MEGTPAFLARIYETERIRIEEQVAELQREKGLTIAELIEAQVENSKLKLEKRVLQRDYGNLQIINFDLAEELDTSKLRNEQLEQECETYNAESIDLLIQNEQLLNERNALKEEISRLNTQLEQIGKVARANAILSEIARREMQMTIDQADENLRARTNLLNSIKNLLQDYEA